MSSPHNRFILRPLELKHLFDFAIRLLRFNFLPMFLSMAMVQLPIALLSIPMSLRLVSMAETIQDPSYLDSSETGEQIWNSLVLDFGDMFLGFMVSFLVIALYQLLVTPLGLLTCSRLIARAMDGIRESFADAFRFSLTRYWQTQVALATFFLPTVALSLLVLIIVLIAQAANSTGAIIASAVAGLILISLMVLATMLMYFRYFPALCGALQAAEECPEDGIVGQGIWYLKRSYALTENNYFRILGLMFLLSIAANMIQSGMRSTIEMFVAIYDYMSSGVGDVMEYFMAQAEGTSDPFQLGVTMVLLTLLMLIFPPYWQCYKFLLYTDLRCRKEAYDIYRLLEDDQRESAA